VREGLTLQQTATPLAETEALPLSEGDILLVRVGDALLLAVLKGDMDIVGVMLVVRDTVVDEDGDEEGVRDSEGDGVRDSEVEEESDEERDREEEKEGEGDVVLAAVGDGIAVGRKENTTPDHVPTIMLPSECRRA
jgi:hypothetical protein